MLLQDHFQAVRELTLNDGFANPGDGLKNSAGLGQIDCEKVTCQLRGHIGAQCDGIVVRHITLHGYGTEAKQRQALQPGHRHGQQHQHKHPAKRCRYRVHEPDVRRHGGSRWQWQGASQVMAP